MDAGVGVGVGVGVSVGVGVAGMALTAAPIGAVGQLPLSRQEKQRALNEDLAAARAATAYSRPGTKASARLGTDGDDGDDGD